MKLDTRAIRYLTSEDWRVLTAVRFPNGWPPSHAPVKEKTDTDSRPAQVEMGSKNHEVVPTPLIAQIAGSRVGTGVHKSISALAKVGLIAKVKNAKCMQTMLTGVYGTAAWTGS